jgi:excisionase family DNA binding protein
VDGRPAILTVQEVARYLRVHVMTVYRMIQRGDLPVVRVGRGWRFKQEQIDRWLADHETNSHRPVPPRRTPATPTGQHRAKRR